MTLSIDHGVASFATLLLSQEGAAREVYWVAPRADLANLKSIEKARKLVNPSTASTWVPAHRTDAIAWSLGKHRWIPFSTGATMLAKIGETPERLNLSPSTLAVIVLPWDRAFEDFPHRSFQNAVLIHGEYLTDQIIEDELAKFKSQLAAKKMERRARVEEAIRTKSQEARCFTPYHDSTYVLQEWHT